MERIFVDCFTYYLFALLNSWNFNGATWSLRVHKIILQLKAHSYKYSFCGRLVRAQHFATVGSVWPDGAILKIIGMVTNVHYNEPQIFGDDVWAILKTSLFM